MATPFATYTDLEARWRTLTPAEQSRANILLADASSLIRDLAPDVADRVSSDSLKAIVCAMVKRAMQGPVDFDGVTQAQQTAGPFSQGVSFANPTGDLYLTAAEKRRLRIGGRMVSVGLVGDRYEIVEDEDEDEDES